MSREMHWNNLHWHSSFLLLGLLVLAHGQCPALSTFPADASPTGSTAAVCAGTNNDGDICTLSCNAGEYPSPGQSYASVQWSSVCTAGAWDPPVDANSFTCAPQCSGPFYGASCATPCHCPNGTCSNGVSGTGNCVYCDARHAGATCNITASCVNGTAANNITSNGACTTCAPGFGQLTAHVCTPCAAGNYNNGSLLCQPCNKGTYANATGVVECLPCQNGTFQDATGRRACKDCAVGQYADGGAESCYQCPLGHYRNETMRGCAQCPEGLVPTDDQDACMECQPGTYLNSTLQACVSCDPGYFSNTTSATQCEPCIKGSFQNSTGGSTCFACAPGSIGTANAQAACTPCPAGYFMPDTGSTAGMCLPCEVGTFAGATGASKCVDCTVGTYQPAEHSSSCPKCPTGGTSLARGTFCFAARGYMSNADKVTFVACVNPDACCGNDVCGPCADACVPIVSPPPAAPATNATGSVTDTGSGAADTGALTKIYSGPRCTVCITGYYSPKKDGVCEACPNNSLGTVIGIGCGLVAACALLVWVARAATNYLTSVTVALNFFQLIATFASFKMNWPPIVETVLEFASASYFNLDVVNVDCIAAGGLDYFALFRLKLALPIACFGIFILFWLVLVLWRGLRHMGYHCADCMRRRCGTRDAVENASLRLTGRMASDKANHELRWACLNAALSAISLLYIMLCDTALQVFRYTTLADGRSVLTAAPLIEVGSADWLELRLYAAIALGVYGAGVPLLFFGVLMAVRHRLHHETVITALGLLYRKYQSHAYLWDLCIMVRKLCVVLVSLVPLDLLYQLILLLVVVLIAAIAHLIGEPYYDQRTNILETVSLVCSVVVLGCGLAILQIGTPNSIVYLYGGWVVLGTLAAFSVVVLFVLVGDVFQIRKMKVHGIVGGYATDDVRVTKHFFRSMFTMVSELPTTTRTQYQTTMVLHYGGPMRMEDVLLSVKVGRYSDFRKWGSTEVNVRVGGLAAILPPERGTQAPSSPMHIVESQANMVQVSHQYDAVARIFRLDFIYRQDGRYRIQVAGAVPIARRRKVGEDRMFFEGAGGLMLTYECDVVRTSSKQRLVSLDRARLLGCMVQSPLTGYVPVNTPQTFSIFTRRFTAIRVWCEKTNKVTQLRRRDTDVGLHFDGDVFIEAEGRYVVQGVLKRENGEVSDRRQKADFLAFMAVKQTFFKHLVVHEEQFMEDTLPPLMTSESRSRLATIVHDRMPQILSLKSPSLSQQPLPPVPASRDKAPPPGKRKRRRRSLAPEDAEPARGRRDRRGSGAGGLRAAAAVVPASPLAALADSSDEEGAASAVPSARSSGSAPRGGSSNNSIPIVEMHRQRSLPWRAMFAGHSMVSLPDTGYGEDAEGMTEEDAAQWENAMATEEVASLPLDSPAMLSDEELAQLEMEHTVGLELQRSPQLVSQSLDEPSPKQKRKHKHRVAVEPNDAFGGGVGPTPRPPIGATAVPALIPLRDPLAPRRAPPALKPAPI